MSSDAIPVVLDCTLRDGGYYNDWVFDRHLVERYLAAVEVAGVDVVEIGFRDPSSKCFLGPFAYSSDRHLKELPLPNGVDIAVMTDAKALLKDGTPERAVNALFQNSRESPVDIVRIAAKAQEVPHLAPAVRCLREKGYRICVNIMQIADQSGQEIEALARTVADFECVDVLYFADSFGSMRPADVNEKVEALRGVWHGAIGVHAHDNMNNALANTLAALDCGASWVDGTVLGMGRGAGNVPTEYLLHSLHGRGLSRYNPDALIPVLMEDFAELRQQYGWGPNYLYYLAAVHGIHPTYLQRLQEPGKIDSESLVNALDYLRQSPSRSFSEEALTQAMRAESVDVAGSWSPSGWAENGDVLLVANGPGLEEHKHAVRDFIRAQKPRVVGLNYISALEPELIDAFAVCHPSRLLRDLPSYRGLDRPLILPMDDLARSFSGYLCEELLRNFGLRIEPDDFAVHHTGCVIPVRKVVPYALALAVAAGAERIFLVGFDGFGVGDARQREMDAVFSLFGQRFSEVELAALTPSSYDVSQSSVYAF